MSEQKALTTEQKKQAILEATRPGGKVSQAKVYPVGNGGIITKLRGDKYPVSPAKIDEIYNNLVIVLDGGTIPKEAKPALKKTTAPKLTTTIHTIGTAQQEKIVSLQAQIKELKAENVRLAEQVKQPDTEPQENHEALAQRLVLLEQRVAQVEQSQAQGAQMPAQNEQVLGWNLTKKTTRTAGKPYRKWYANRGGHCVYVGNDTHKAAQKIRAYCAKKGLDLCEANK